MPPHHVAPYEQTSRFSASLNVLLRRARTAQPANSHGKVTFPQLIGVPATDSTCCRLTVESASNRSSAFPSRQFSLDRFDVVPLRASSVTLSLVAADAISIGGVDLADPDTYVTGVPFDAFRELRRCAPVAWHPHHDGPGFLALTGYDEVLAVSRDSTTWSSQAAGVFFEVPSPDDEFQLSLMMLTMDPPRHTKLRSLVSKGFTPRQVARLNDHVADMARHIVDEVAERGECDFVDDVAGALPSYVIAELLGIPLQDGRRLYGLTEIMNSGAVGEQNGALDARMEMFSYGSELAARKRAVPRRRHRHVTAAGRGRR
jgi:hypothetical protein